jgi:hypothetical protein
LEPSKINFIGKNNEVEIPGYRILHLLRFYADYYSFAVFFSASTAQRALIS